MIDYKKDLKEKLWASIDNLPESDGFVLVATEDTLSFTPIKAGGWSDRILELEPLDHAQLSRWNDELRSRNESLKKENASLKSQRSKNEKRLKEINAAISMATGVDIGSSPLL